MKLQLQAILNYSIDSTQIENLKSEMQEINEDFEIMIDFID